jgi:hypothetical protein
MLNQKETKVIPNHCWDYIIMCQSLQINILFYIWGRQRSNILTNQIIYGSYHHDPPIIVQRHVIKTISFEIKSSMTIQ